MLPARERTREIRRRTAEISRQKPSRAWSFVDAATTQLEVRLIGLDKTGAPVSET